MQTATPAALLLVLFLSAAPTTKASNSHGPPDLRSLDASPHPVAAGETLSLTLHLDLWCYAEICGPFYYDAWAVFDCNSELQDGELKDDIWGEDWERNGWAEPTATGELPTSDGVTFEMTIDVPAEAHAGEHTFCVIFTHQWDPWNAAIRTGTVEVVRSELLLPECSCPGACTHNNDGHCIEPIACPVGLSDCLEPWGIETVQCPGGGNCYCPAGSSWCPKYSAPAPAPAPAPEPTPTCDGACPMQCAHTNGGDDSCVDPAPCTLGQDGLCLFVSDLAQANKDFTCESGRCYCPAGTRWCGGAQGDDVVALPSRQAPSASASSATASPTAEASNDTLLAAVGGGALLIVGIVAAVVVLRHRAARRQSAEDEAAEMAEVGGLQLKTELAFHEARGASDQPAPAGHATAV